MDVVIALRRVLVENELGGNLDLAYRFSDPDGVRTGKSGYSFGRCQYDLLNNATARQILLECRFALRDVVALINQTCSLRMVKAYDEQLRRHAEIIDRWDEHEMSAIVRHVRTTLLINSIKLASGETFVHLCDYHNQFHLDVKGKCITHLLTLDRPVTPDDILKFKYTTLWGQKRRDDVQRRYNNIVRICHEVGNEHHARIEQIRKNHRRSDG